MLLLVLSDRHVRGAIEQDVRRHQHRIIVETHGGVLAILARLLLELGHAAEPADARNAIEDPCQFGVAGDLALVEYDVLLRIDAGGNERRGDLAGVAGQFRRAAPDVHPLRDRVHVDDAIDAIMGFLHLHEVDDRAEVIAEMQIARRLDARKYFFNKSHSQLPEDACFALSFATRAVSVQAARCIRALSRHPRATALPLSLEARKSAHLRMTDLAKSRHGLARGLPDRVNRLAPAGDAEKPQKQ